MNHPLPPARPLTRRRFLERTSLGVATLGTLGNASQTTPTRPAPPGQSPTPPLPQPWYANAWRRAVIDMHIPDWDRKFLSGFDADQYVDALARSKTQSIVLYVHSHVGLFNYPTRVGKPHAGLQGRDIVAELIDRCHRRGIAVVLYSSLIHDRWAFDTHPDWRMKHARGFEFGTNSRYGVVCPNSPYRDYVRAWVRELCERYSFEGMRFDMTFWVGVCYCQACQARWQREVGGDMPRTCDWSDPQWVRLQRKREEWLADFAAVATTTVHQLQPAATVEHQASTYPLGWSNGASYPLVEQNDFLQGDFYGDQLQGSFVRKLLSELTPKRPFGYETSFSLELRDHTGRKSEPLLEAKAAAAIADHAAFIFIDAIDPIGTVNPATHERMGRVFNRLMPFYQHLGGSRVADIALYHSLDSKFDPAENGKPVADLGNRDSHTESAMNAARCLLHGHLPFTVLTRRSLHRLPDFRLLLLSNVHHLGADEAAAIRTFVSRGGAIYASGDTSLVDPAGHRHPDFQLADVLGVSLVRADWNPREHYIAPTSAGQPLFGDWTATYPAFVKGYGFEVAARPGAEVLATTTDPWPTGDNTRFSSIHSNPPWVPTQRAELVRHRFGQGTSLYAASLIENVDGLRDTFLACVRSLCPPFRIEAEAPPPVEVTLFHQPERHRYVLSLVNFQKDLPNIPVQGIRLTLRLPETIRRITAIPSNQRIRFSSSHGHLTLTAPRLETFAMLACHYG